jgi:hypothetical protein
MVDDGFRKAWLSLLNTQPPKRNSNSWMVYYGSLSGDSLIESEVRVAKSSIYASFYFLSSRSSIKWLSTLSGSNYNAMLLMFQDFSLRGS